MVRKEKIRREKRGVKEKGRERETELEKGCV